MLFIDSYPSTYSRVSRVTLEHRSDAITQTEIRCSPQRSGRSQSRGQRCSTTSAAPGGRLDVGVGGGVDVGLVDLRRVEATVDQCLGCLLVGRRLLGGEVTPPADERVRHRVGGRVAVAAVVGGRVAGVEQGGVGRLLVPGRGGGGGGGGPAVTRQLLLRRPPLAEQSLQIDIASRQWIT